MTTEETVTSSGIVSGQHWVRTAQAASENDNRDPSLEDDDYINSTASITSSILQYRTIHGRTYHSERGNARYWGSNDEQQNESMDINHNSLLLALNNKLYLAPLEGKIQRALDVGTGTGIWAIDFADEFPDTEVIGTDISPIQPSWVPPNLKFEIEDCTQEWSFPPNSFDYIHMRWLNGSIDDWTALLKEAYKCCKPGGYVESFEGAPYNESDDGTVRGTDALGQWGKIFVEGGRRLGRSFTVVPDGTQRKALEQAGFVNIEERDLKTPIGGWSQDPKLKDVGRFAQAALTQDVEGYVLLMAAEIGWSRDETLLYAAQVRREIRSGRFHAFYRQKVVWGRKPDKGNAGNSVAKMLPGPLISIYQQYKQDTDSVASWLASTAKACGYPADLLAPAPVGQQKSARLKGKARKEAKKAGNASNTQSTSRPKYTVAIKDFIPLAEFIAAREKPCVTVPQVFADTISRVITVRTGFSSNLDDQGVPVDEKSDAKHSYFVGILEKVREVLQPRMPATTMKSTSQEPTVEADDGLSNKFSALTVYEPSKDFLDAPDIERPPRAENDDVVYEAEPQTTLDDAILAFVMLLNDLNKIRSHIEWVWSNFGDGFFDLGAAALTTNTAIDLARNLMEDIIPLFKDHGGAWGISNKFFFVQCIQKGASPDEVFVDENDQLTYDYYDVADGMFFNAFRNLDGFLRVLSPKRVPLYKDGTYGIYEPKSNRQKKSGRKKFQEDQVLLMEFFTELMTVARVVRNYPVEDEFLRGMKEMDRTREIPFYLVFAAQIFLDIHHKLRKKAVRGFKFLLKHITFMDNDLRLHLNFHENLKIEHWPASNDAMLRTVLKKIKMISDDPVYQAKAKIYEGLGSPIPPTIDIHRMLKRSPVISGLLLYHFRAEMYDIGIAVANAWGSITYSAHLYNAIRNEKLLNARWADMDIATTLLGESNFYVGNPPQTSEDYFKRFCLQMGVTASVFTQRAQGRRQKLASNAGPRGIKTGIPVSSMFEDRYRHNTGQVDWTPQYVDYIVDKSEYELEGSQEDGTLVLGQIEDEKKLKDKRKVKQQKKTAEGARIPPERLIKALVFALQGESLELTFPYLTMHRWCWKALRAVKETCDPLLREAYTPAYMERETELPFVVGYIFMAASGMEGGVKDDRLLRSAAKEVNEMIRAGAGRLVIDSMNKVLDMVIEIEDGVEEGDEEHD